EHVAPAQLERVATHLPGQGIDGLLPGEGLKLPRSSVGGARAGVGVSGAGGDRHFRNAVRTGEDHRGHGPGAGDDGVGPDVIEMIEADAEDAAVVVRGNRHGAAIVSGRGGSNQVLAAVFDPTEGPTHVVSGEDHDLFVASQVGLLAEAATDVTDPNANATFGDTRYAAGDRPDVVGRLARYPDIEELRMRVPGGDDPAGFHRDRQVAVLHESFGDHVRRRVEDLLQFAVNRQHHLASQVAVAVRTVDNLAAGDCRLIIDD